jgi:mono/diheme cytochrome c family protein
MNKEEQQAYLESYKEEKKHGIPFFPDAIFKDAVITLVIFAILIALAYFLGAPLEARANPSDTTYTPKPEWYFLFLFQLLKYFPGQLEVVGVVLIPSLAILLLAALPFIDRSAKRHPLNRLGVIVGTALVVAAVGTLTYLAIAEAPPPTETRTGDPTAALYIANCAPCHGPSITVPPGTNLHEVIAQGKHNTDMPAWGADLTTDQIDALAGFILSPRGSQVFQLQCSKCHAQPVIASGNPLEIKRALDQGPEYQAHANQGVPRWSEVMTAAEMTALMNFLAAPDGERLFAINCASCHGNAVAFSGPEGELRKIIAGGGQHLDMPAWRGKLSDADIDQLAQYVVSPSSVAGGADLFKQNCSACHGQRIPSAADVATAREIIASGDQHKTMPVWGNVLTAEQLDALVAYTEQLISGAPVEAGRELFAKNCSPCHGDFGEGGPNPSRPGSTIPPISSGEFLNTRDDTTLRAIIAQGQPNYGMSPFSSSNGGPLDDDQIDAVVAFLRSWQANPPVELPPEVPAGATTLNGQQVFAQLCSQCHGAEGQGGIGPSLRSEAFQNTFNDQELFDTISQGHTGTAMVAWGGVLSSQQIEDLVKYIRTLALPIGTPMPGGTPAVGAVSFKSDILPAFKDKCGACHGSMGGWDSTSYASVMQGGNSGPVVVAGDPDNSLLVQKLQGTQATGGVMPPGGKLPEAQIQLIIQWIKDGAPDN